MPGLQPIPSSPSLRAPSSTSSRAYSLSRGSTAETTLSEPELVGVRPRVHALELLDAVDVVARLGELDSPTLLAPAVDVRLACVVGGERRALLAVAIEQVPQVPRAVADV